ncbi:hypothetical protein ACFL0O_10795, partial [Thermodesulfobacteriota bacterium]
RIEMTGGTSGQGLWIEQGSFLRVNGNREGAGEEIYEIDITTDLGVYLYGSLYAEDAGADIRIDAGGRLLVDGFALADDQLVLMGGPDEIVSVQGGDDIIVPGVQVKWGGVVDTSESGKITINGQGTITLEGGIELTSEQIEISTSGELLVTNLLKAKRIVEINSGGLIVGDDGRIEAGEAGSGSEVRINSSGDVFISDSPSSAGFGTVSADERVQIHGANVSIAGRVETLSSSSMITVSSLEYIQVTGMVASANTIEFYAGERDVDGNFLGTTDDEGNVLGDILITYTGQLVADGDGLNNDTEDSISLNAAGDVEIIASVTGQEDRRQLPDYNLFAVTRVVSKPVGIIHFVDPDNPTITETRTEYYETTYMKEVDWEPLLVGGWYYTVGVDVDQIGWYDAGTGKELPIGDDGQPTMLPSTGDTFGANYEDPEAPGATTPFRRLYKASYKDESGLLHTMLYGKDRVLVKETDELVDAIDAGSVDPSLPSDYLGEGYVYITKTDYLYLLRGGVEVEQMEYVPDWNAETEWEYVHCSEFLGTIYSALPASRRPDFWLKIQVGAKDDIKKSIALPAEELEYYQAGNTWMEAKINLHQIGWWWTGWKDGLPRNAIADDPENKKVDYTWDPNWKPEGFPDGNEPLTLAWFTDSRETVQSGPAYEHNDLFQKGVKKPDDGGDQWVPWYVLEYIDDSGVRQVEIFDGEYLGYDPESDTRLYDLGEYLGIYPDELDSNWGDYGEYETQAEALAAMPAIGTEIINPDGSLSRVEEHRTILRYDELWTAAVKYSYYNPADEFIGSYQENIDGLFTSEQEADLQLPPIGATFPEDVIRRVVEHNVALHRTEVWSAGVTWGYYYDGEFLGSEQEIVGVAYESNAAAVAALDPVGTTVLYYTEWRVSEHRTQRISRVETWSAEVEWDYYGEGGEYLGSVWWVSTDEFGSQTEALDDLKISHPINTTEDPYTINGEVKEHRTSGSGTEWKAEAKWEYTNGLGEYIGEAWIDDGNVYDEQSKANVALASLPTVGSTAPLSGSRKVGVGGHRSQLTSVEEQWSAEALWEVTGDGGTKVFDPVLRSYGNEHGSEAEALAALAALPDIGTTVIYESVKRVDEHLTTLETGQENWSADVLMEYSRLDGLVLGFNWVHIGDYPTQPAAEAALPALNAEDIITVSKKVARDVDHILNLVVSQEWWKAEAKWNKYSEAYEHYANVRKYAYLEDPIWAGSGNYETREVVGKNAAGQDISLYVEVPYYYVPL